jgi:23S rRNA (pseudouridine1915-N3)-methyltransferase
MKLHILVIGKPKLAYAQSGWDEYLGRLTRLHTVRISQLSDKYAYDAAKILETAGTHYKVVLEITGTQLTSPELAGFLVKRELESREICFIIGGPDGLPQHVRTSADYQLSFGKLTFPHDLAMVILLESLYRASTINAGLPYHK